MIFSFSPNEAEFLGEILTTLERLPGGSLFNRKAFQCELLIFPYLVIFRVLVLLKLSKEI